MLYSAAKNHFHCVVFSPVNWLRDVLYQGPGVAWELEAFLLGGWVSSLGVGSALIAGTAQARQAQNATEGKISVLEDSTSIFWLQLVHTCLLPA